MQQFARPLALSLTVFLAGLVAGVGLTHFRERDDPSAGISDYYDARADTRPTLRAPHYRSCARPQNHMSIPALCIELVLGGKVFVFGAPEADWSNLSETPEAVFLMGDWPDQFQGLSSLRTWTWRLGRSSPLTVFGSSGVSDIVSGVEMASVLGDAGLVVISDGRLDYSGAGLTAVSITTTGRDWQTLLDTGDVHIAGRVEISPNGAERPIYRVRYLETLDIVLAECLDWPNDALPPGLDYAFTSAINSEALGQHISESRRVVENGRARALADVNRGCVIRAAGEQVFSPFVVVSAHLDEPRRVAGAQFVYAPLKDDGVPLAQDPVLPISPPSGQ